MGSTSNDDLLRQALDLVRLGDALEPVLRAALALTCRRTGFDSGVVVVEVDDPDRPTVAAGYPNDHAIETPAPAATLWTVGCPTVVTLPVGDVGLLSLRSERNQPYDAAVVAFVGHVADLLATVTGRAGDAARRRSAEHELRRSQENLAEAQRLAHIGSWQWDVEADDIRWSDELYRIYGLEEDGPAIFEDYVERVHPHDREKVVTAVRDAVERLRGYEHDYRIVWPDGSIRWVHAAGGVTAHSGAKATRLGGFCHDITEQRTAELKRQHAQEALAGHRQILEQIARGERVSATLEALCRDVEQRCPGAYCSILMVVPGERVLRHAAAPSLPQEFRTAIDGLPINDEAGACGRAAARLHDIVVSDTLGDTLTMSFRALAEKHQLRSVWSHPLVTSTGELLGTFAVYRHEPHVPDTEERETVAAAGSIAAVAIERARAEAALRAAARQDALTGLANRATFLEQLGYRLTRAGETTGVMFCDLDRFMWINESLGHGVGDRILVDVAWRLERALDGRHLLARFGGDEFTVLVEDAANADLTAIAAALHAEMTAPFQVDGGEFYLSLSVGIAVSTGTETATDLIRDADTALHAAKERGRGRSAMFDAALRERAVERVTTEADLRRAIQQDEIVMHYQPIIDLRTGERAGIESLVRWPHALRGLVPPDSFIPLAEETGLINPLGQRIVTRVLTEARQLPPSTYVSVNVSAVQLGDPTFADELTRALDRHSIAPERFVVEVTETAVMHQIDTARTALGRLTEGGVRVLIDDFGTGYSSIARLQEFPVAGVKVDKSFCGDLGNGTKTDGVVAAIVELAHAIELDVLVEGIETPAAAARAAEIGCDYAQGYHYARPAPLVEL